MTAIDWNKPVQTKDGQKVRVLCKDGPNYLWPVIGLVAGKEHPDRWNALGAHDNPYGWDNLGLINVPEKHELWVNVWRGPDGTILLFNFLSRKDADTDAGLTGRGTLIARIHREFHEGEGLS